MKYIELFLFITHMYKAFCFGNILFIYFFEKKIKTFLGFDID
jgi:hypothetical protein